jgi:hypothetical protein
VRTDLSSIFGHPVAEPQLDAPSSGARALIERIERDGEPYLEVARSLPRTARRLPAAAMLADHMLRGASAAGAIDGEAAWDVFLWIVFALAVDEAEAEIDSPGDIGPWLRRVFAAATAPLPSGADGPARFLHALASRLRRRATFALYEPLFSEALAAMRDALERELDHRVGGGAATLESYLEVATRSVGIEPLLAVALIALGDPRLAMRRDEVRAASAMVATVARLANDMRACDRLADGKTGALELAARELGVPPERLHLGDRDDVLRLLGAAIRLELCDLCDCVPFLDDAHGHFAACLIDTTAAVLRICERGELRDLAVRP